MLKCEVCMNSGDKLKVDDQYNNFVVRLQQAQKQGERLLYIDNDLVIDVENISFIKMLPNE